jgi:hypothetical protein
MKKKASGPRWFRSLIYRILRGAEKRFEPLRAASAAGGSGLFRPWVIRAGKDGRQEESDGRAADPKGDQQNGGEPQVQEAADARLSMLTS